MLIPKYYEQWADIIEDYINEIDEDLWRCIKRVNFHPDMLEDIGTIGSTADMDLRKS